MTSTRFGDNGVAIERLDVSAYTVPTDFPESDGTIKWDKTTLVLVEATAGGKRSVGSWPSETRSFAALRMTGFMLRMTKFKMNDLVTCPPERAYARDGLSRRQIFT
jgi:hypothetical protein